MFTYIAFWNRLLPKKSTYQNSVKIDDMGMVSCGDRDELKYYPNKTIGRGSSKTTVYEGAFRSRPVAIKHSVITTGDTCNEYTAVNCLLECDAHENVIRYFCHETLQSVNINQLFVAVELCHANLEEWVTGKYVADIERTQVLKQITHGLAYLHSQRIAHRDLKPENILILKLTTNEVRMKLSGFSASVKLPKDRKFLALKNMSTGNDWTAPESLQHEEKLVVCIYIDR